MGRWVIAAGVVLSMLAGCAGTKRYTREEWERIEDRERRADHAFDRGDFVEAAEHYDWVIRTYPRIVNEHHLSRRASVYLLQRDYERALRFTTQVALPQFPDSPSILEQQALILWGLKRHEESIAVAKRVVSRRMRSYQTQLLLGTYYYGRDPNRAAIAFTAYLAYRPAALADRDGMPRLKLGLAHLALKNPGAALEQFRIVKAQFRDERRYTINATNGMCAAYTALEDIERAVEQCEAIVNERHRIDRTGSAVHNLAINYIRLERWDEALVLARQYFDEYNPNIAKSWSLLAEAHIGTGQCEEGERAIDKAARRGADDAEVARLRDRLAHCREP